MTNASTSGPAVSGRSESAAGLAPFGRRVTDVAGEVASDRLDLSILIGIFRRRMVMFFTILALCIQLAVVITQFMPVLYTATAEVVLRPRTDPITPGDATTSDQPARAEEVETEIAYLTSRDLMGKVFDTLGLAKDKAFVAALSTDDGVTVRDAGINTLLKGLDVHRVGSAYALQITYVDRAAERSARVANGLAQIYTRERVASEAADNMTAIRVLQSRMEELRHQAQQDFGALQAYRIRNNLQSKSATALTEQEISTYNQQVAAARAEASQASSRLAAAEAQARGGMADDTSASAVLTALRSQRAQISARLSDLQTRYRDNHPDVAAAREQMRDMDRQIVTEERRSLSTLAAESYTAGQKLASLSSSLGRANGTLSANNAALVAMDDLERRAEASQTLYDGYLGRYKEAVARSGAEQPKSAILSPALVPTDPSSPNRLLNIVLGTLIGLFLGATAAIVAEGGYAGLTTSDDIERKLGVRYLGSLPLANSVKPHADSAHGTIAAYPGGLLAESVRGVFTSARQGGRAPNQIYAVTSSLPGEGKTTVSLAMAQIARLAGQKVILIDCDAVRRTLSTQFASSADKPGLREFLAGGVPLRDVVTTIIDGVAFLPITTKFSKGERLMQDGRFDQLLVAIRETFDIIILDCAPVLPIAETRELVALADNVIMVTRWRSTRSHAVRAALKLLPLKSIQNLGAILNGVDMRKRVRFGGGDSDVFHKDYEAYYS